jgi:hypothetical protein
MFRTTKRVLRFGTECGSCLQRGLSEEDREGFHQEAIEAAFEVL